MFRTVFTNLGQIAIGLCLVILCGHPTWSAPVSDPVQARIEQLFELAETSKEDALTQLLRLQEGLSTQAAYVDQRAALATLVYLYIQNDLLEQARKKNMELHVLAERFNDNWSRAMTLNFNAYLLRNAGRPDDAKAQIDQAIALAQTVNDPRLTSVVHRTAGIIDDSSGDFHSALTHELLALENAGSGSRGANIWRITILNDIGQLYSSLKNVDAALEYNERATRLAQSVNAEDKLEVLMTHRGNIYSEQHRLDDAFNAYSESLTRARKSGFEVNQFLALVNLSDVTYLMGNYRQCLQYADQALQLKGKVTGNYYIGVASINGGLCRMHLDDMKRGAKQVEDGVAILRKLNDRTAIESVLGQLADAYAHGGMYREAFQTLSEKTALTLQLFSLNRDHAIAELQSRYNNMQQKAKIEELEHQSQLQKADIRNKSLLQIIALLVTLVALCMATLIYLLYRKVKLSNLRLKEANQNLEFQSKRDPLTGLLNRRAFYDSLKKRRKVSERRLTASSPGAAALLILDIDQFKLTNDTFGHIVGDIVLVEVSHRLSTIMRDQDKLMRWGGEEFLVYLHGMNQESLDRIVERALAVVGGTAIEVEVHQLDVTVSIGYVLLAQGDDSDAGVQQALKFADAALYRAKISGRNRAVGVVPIGTEAPQWDVAGSVNLDLLVNENKVSISTILGPPKPAHHD